ncbi:DUF5723 family protein [Daejeonella oryzae]|uniref:DUF5723 family protein n=1 Tax=Daejeonella oryzae TaxID=1122943 RepID=UPI0006868736|nr:DUF5723 family protein [Daejeonella oryzae]
MKKISLTLLLGCLFFNLNAQQLSLYNSQTLYDAFENPSQKAFKADTSRKFAFNFFIPTVSVNGAFTGPAQSAFKYLAYNSVINGQGISLGYRKTNTIEAHTNTYLAMFRIFRSVTFNSEFGLAWQIRNDGNLKVSNESLAIFDNYKLFSAGQNQFNDIFNDKGYNQSYHQFSLSYREDYNRRLSLGVKLSLLSGISYNKLKVEQSNLSTNGNADRFDVDLKGNFKSSFLTNEVNEDILYPKFNDPGLAFSAGASYKFRGGWFLLGNVKDLGFIRWSKDSYDYNFDQTITIANASNGTADERLNDAIGKMINDIAEETGYTSVINGKAEILLNKNFGAYHPNLIISKNLFYPGGNIALINNYHVKNFVLTASGAYNQADYMQIGGQFMIKSPNVELFIGSDQLFKTLQAAKALRKEDPEIGKGYSGASAYLGFAVKFGPAMEHPLNANRIPGLEEKRTAGDGIFKRIFNKFRRK